jgi:hypothetical protein
MRILDRLAGPEPPRLLVVDPRRLPDRGVAGAVIPVGDAAVLASRVIGRPTVAARICDWVGACGDGHVGGLSEVEFVRERRWIADDRVRSRRSAASTW